MVLAPGPVAFPEKLSLWLDQNCPSGWYFAGKETETVYRQLYGADRLVLASPSFDLIRAIARGEDGQREAKTFLLCLLWGKPAVILLDFWPPMLNCGPLFSPLSQDLAKIAQQGVSVQAYAVSAPPMAAAGLVTEPLVRQAARMARPLCCGKNTLFTPAAQDAAKALGVRMIRE